MREVSTQGEFLTLFFHFLLTTDNHKVCSPIEDYQEAAAYTLYPVDTPENSVTWDSWADKSNNPSKVLPTLITNPKKVLLAS